jgi:hypothetical protein
MIKIQNSKQNHLGHLDIADWDLFGICHLEFEIWSLRIDH